MNRVKIVIDTAACLLEEHIKEFGIETIPPNIHFEGRTYRDGIDIDSAKAYEFLEKAPDFFSTSPASPEAYANVFRKIAKQGHDILCFTVSLKISTMYNMASVAKGIVEAEFPATSIEVVDSLTASASEGLIALETARFVKEGRGIQEVVQFAKSARKKASVVLIMQTLKYVYRTGRVPKVASRIGSKLPLKPILVISGGSAHISAVSRTMKNGVRRMIDMVKKKVGNTPIRVAVLHAQVSDKGTALMKMIESELNCQDIYLTEFSPIIGYITGRGALGIAYYRISCG